VNRRDSGASARRAAAGAVLLGLAAQACERPASDGQAALIERYRTTESRLSDTQVQDSGCLPAFWDHPREDCRDRRRSLARQILAARVAESDRAIASSDDRLLLLEGRPQALLDRTALTKGPSERQPPPDLLVGIAYLERAQSNPQPFDLVRSLDLLLAATEQAPDSPAAWFDLGLVAAKLHLCGAAERAFARAAGLETDAGWSREIAERLGDAGCLAADERAAPEAATIDAAVFDRLFEAGNFEGVVEAVDRSLSATPGDANAAAHLHWLRGTALMALGRLGDAIETYHRALAAYAAAANRGRQGAVHSLLASAYSVAGNPALSWQHRLWALEALAEAGLYDRLGVSLSAVAYEAYDEGLFRAAEQILLEVENAAADEAWRATIATYRARALAALGRVEAARRLLDGIPPPDASDGPLLLRRGEALAHLGDLDASISTLSKAVTALEAGRERLLLTDALLERGETLAAQARLPEARHDLEQALAGIELERSSLSPLERPAFLDAAGRALDLAVRLELASGTPASALQVVEASAARTLRDHLGAGASAVTAPTTPVTPPTLSGDLLVLRFHLLEDRLLRWTLRGGRTTFRQVPISRGLIAEHTRSLRAALRANRPEEADGALRWLGELLLGDALSGAVPGEIVIIPSGVLYAVPFGALIDPASDRRLLELARLRTVPSLDLVTSASADRRVVAPEGLDSLFVATSEASALRPLRFARQAAGAAVANYAGHGEVQLLADLQATPAAVREALPRARLVELSVHSLSTPSFLGSTLLLAGGSAEQPATLSAEEIAGLDLSRLSLAILSSCDSSSSSYRGTEGIGGLQWAFLSAGATAVIATLWEVDDREAAEFTTRFHQQLLGGAGVADALRRASLGSLAAGRWVWAAFAHYGSDWRLPATPA
jgi:CHAT domain-containing protein/predicted negative regulator of RcsB-dependent stress response